MSGIPSWARVGAKVVCVDDACHPGRVFYHRCPPHGTVCTIDGFSADIVDGTPTLVIAGYPNMWGLDDIGWASTRFRPLITIEDDISTHFRQLLDVPAHHGADA